MNLAGVQDIVDVLQECLLVPLESAGRAVGYIKFTQCMVYNHGSKHHKLDGAC